jgi:hypothetical protein
MLSISNGVLTYGGLYINLFLFGAGLFLFIVSVGGLFFIRREEHSHLTHSALELITRGLAIIAALLLGASVVPPDVLRNYVGTPLQTLLTSIFGG